MSIQVLKYCKNCGKELTASQKHNTYCSSACAADAIKKQKIKDWLDGTTDETKGSNGQLSTTVRDYLLEKANYRCSLCGWHEINPTTNLVPLEVHHIDGNYKNNSYENLQVLCPNCHALTPNYKSLNKDSNRERTITRKNFCIDCGKEIGQGSLRCIACSSKARITEKPVTREELKEKIRTTPFVTIGMEYGVTDNTIRKWCIRYNLPSKKKDIIAYSDEEWATI